LEYTYATIFQGHPTNSNGGIKMKRFATLCAVTTMALTMTACNQTPDTHDADVAAIQANEAQWNQDYAARDLDKIAAHYADDAVLIIPGAPPTTGKAAIGAASKQMTADPAMVLQFHPTKVDVAKSGDLAYSQGVYTLTITDMQTHQPINDHGSYVTTYRKQPDGTWKAVVDIVTSEVPPPAPAPTEPQPKKKTKG
jgi:uncharacterized protein (TIGR02246 family)